MTLLCKHGKVSRIHHPLVPFEAPKIAFTRIAIATIAQKRVSLWVDIGSFCICTDEVE